MTDTAKDWMQTEIVRLRSLPCLCEPCSCVGSHEECNGMGVSVQCERCEQIEELEISKQYASREQHGHFGSL